jgi:hypothetical protein
MMAIKLRGRFRWQTVLNGNILQAGVFPNGIITATIDDLFDVYFSNGSPAAAWYLAPISNTNFSALDPSDTMLDHAGWQEATNYSGGSRPLWSPNNSAGGVKLNASAVEFPITSEEALAGMFVTSDNTLDGTAGTLWATGQFATGANTPPVGSIFKLFYELEGREG